LRGNESLIVVVWAISWVRIVQIGELGVEVNVMDWSTISERLITNNSLAWAANSESSMAENSHSNSQNNINDIITRSSSVGISGQITSSESKSALVSSRSDSNGSIESEEISHLGSRLKIVVSGNSSEESSNEIVSGEVGWGNGGEASSEN